MTRLVHPIAGAIAMVTIAAFWVSTVLAELFAPAATVATVKSTIPWALLLLIPALLATAGSGVALANGRPRGGLVGTKMKRMRFIAANGLLVLVPSALFLASRAAASDFDTAFYAVQALELSAGAVNLALLGLNMRDGLKMTGRLRPRRAKSLLRVRSRA